jgi:hypothetical protein
MYLNNWDSVFCICINLHLNVQIIFHANKSGIRMLNKWFNSPGMIPGGKRYATLYSSAILMECLKIRAQLLGFRGC